MISELYETLSDELRAALDVTVYVGWPTSARMPAIVLEPPEGTWVEAGDTFGGSYLVHARCLCLVSKSQDELTTLVEGVLHNTADWKLIAVGSPRTYPIGGANFLGADILIQKMGKL